MLRASMKSLMAHKLRLTLTALAIILGVAFVAGTFVLTDTVKHTFDQLFAQTSAGKTVVVRAVAPYGTPGGFSDRQGNDRPLTPQSVLDAVKGVPGVAGAEGTVQGRITLITKAGKPLKKQAPTLAFNWFNDRSLSALTIVSGRGPQAPDEISLDRGTAKSEHFVVGDKVELITNAGPGTYTIVGLTKFGSTDNLAGATLVNFDTATAQRLAGTPGFFNEVDIAAKPGTSTDGLLSAVGDALPKGFEAISGAQAAQQMANQVSSFTTVFQTFLLTFAGIALFVGAFLIANTFSILIGQRTRELAVLRALGASRRQVTYSLMIEAFVTGLFGSVLGLILGVPLAAGLYALLKAAGLGLPTSTLQVLPRTIYVSLIVGVVITMISSVGPSVRASRIPPVAAMRDDAVVLETSLRRRAVIGGIATVIGLIALFGGLFGGGSNPLPLVGLGAGLTFVGVAVLAPFFAGVLARAIGAPLPAVAGITGRLGQENASRNPKRTASTASALMVGLGVVSAIATLATSLSSSFTSVVNADFRGTYVVAEGSGFGGGGFVPAAAQAAKRAPGVIAASGLTEAQWHENRASKTMGVIDPADGPTLFNLQAVHGSLTTLAQGEIAIDDKVATSRHLKVGDVIQVGWVQTGVQPMTIGATYKTNQLLGDNYIVSYNVASKNVTNLRYDLLALKTSTANAQEQKTLSDALSAYPNLSVKTAAQFNNQQKSRFNTFLLIVYVLLALSIIIAAFSVVNTMALSIIERVREIGLLRSIGMIRRQVRSMVRWEAVIVALFGAILGLVLGLGLGSAVVAAIGKANPGLGHVSIPVPTIIVVLILAGVIGVLAAVFPARRAARLDVLQAIHSA